MVGAGVEEVVGAELFPIGDKSEKTTREELSTTAELLGSVELKLTMA